MSYLIHVALISPPGPDHQQDVDKPNTRHQRHHHWVIKEGQEESSITNQVNLIGRNKHATGEDTQVITVANQDIIRARRPRLKGTKESTSN